MKKLFLVLITSATIIGIHTTAFAVDSPSGQTTTVIENKSPKTGDTSILFVEAAGVLLAVTALVSGKRYAKAN